MGYRIGLCLLLLAVIATAGDEDKSCLNCHADHIALQFARKDKSRDVAHLLVDPEVLGRSVHMSKSCGDCHFDYDTHPHGEDAETAACTECHEEAGEIYAKSVHGSSNENPASCRDCHGVHDVFKNSDREAKLHPLNVHVTCGKCHFGRNPAEMTVDELLHHKYTGDEHGHGLLKSGLVLSATCVSCHGGHAIREKDDPESQVARKNVENVCGKCHLGALEEYRKSIHFLKSGNGHEGATCTDCHHPHEISRSSGDFLTQSVRSCSKCHDQRGGSFRQSYHGKAAYLGFAGKAATCNACHANHAVLPASDRDSWVHKNNIVATCGKCHDDSHEEFTKYLVHADYTDQENFPRLYWVWMVMTSLLVGVLILGGLHALMWLVRATADGEWRRPKPSKAVMRYLRRWPPSYVAYHMALMTTVLLLAGTGLPLHYADMDWSQSLMAVFGGPGAAGWVHRASGVALMALFAVYMVHLIWRWLVQREKGLFFGPDSMVPRKKDLSDLWGNIKWFLFLAPRPKYDRWTYWEKFDFWAVFWGLFVIGLTGLMLWFPEQATRFVPGWFLNAAVIVHGIEALLDIAFIFSVHIFHANLRPDKFPMDTMFLSGVISEQEFRHERPEEYERMVKAGTLESLLADPPSRRRRITAYVIGTIALATGFFFVAMMIVAVVQKWS